MRHRVKGRKLGRTASHRQATLNALATQLLKYKKIKTTTAKAKELKKFVEPLLTKAKKNDLVAKRHITRFIKDKEIFKELFSEIIEKIAERQGGYTRVIKLGNRAGDAAEMSIIELVDYNEVAAPKKKSTKEQTEESEPKTKKFKKAPKKEEAAEAEVVEEVEEKSDESEEKSEATEDNVKGDVEKTEEVKEGTKEEEKEEEPQAEAQSEESEKEETKKKEK